MSLNFATLTTNELGHYNQDRLLLCGENLLAKQFRENGSFAINWGSTAGGTDKNLASAPAKWGADGYVHRRTKSSTTGTTLYLSCDLGAALAFDVCAVIGHNIESGGWSTLELIVFDPDTGFGGTPTTIATWGSLGAEGSRRLVSTLLKHTGSDPLRYTHRYVMLKATFSPATTPAIGEWFLGRRRQLGRQPDRPFDPSTSVSRRALGESHTGVMTPYVHHRGRYVANLLYSVGDADTINALLDYWTDCRQGTAPGLAILNPKTAPDTTCALVLPDPAEIHFPYRGPVERTTQLTLFEQGDSFVALET